jgi:hypothetical protein
MNGRTVQPALLASPEDFIHRAFVPLQGASEAVSEADQGFLRHCQMENRVRVQFTGFKRAAKDLVMGKFQLGLRHDIRTPEDARRMAGITFPLCLTFLDKRSRRPSSASRGAGNSEHYVVVDRSQSADRSNEDIIGQRIGVRPRIQNGQLFQLQILERGLH